MEDLQNTCNNCAGGETTGYLRHMEDLLILKTIFLNNGTDIFRQINNVLVALNKLNLSCGEWPKNLVLKTFGKPILTLGSGTLAPGISIAKSIDRLLVL